MARLHAITAALPRVTSAPDSGLNTPYIDDLFGNGFPRVPYADADIFAAMHARIPFWKMNGTLTASGTWNDGEDRSYTIEATFGDPPTPDIDDTIFEDITVPDYWNTLPNTGIEPSEKYLAYAIRLVRPQFRFSTTGDLKMFTNGILDATVGLDVSASIEAAVSGATPSVQFGGQIYPAFDFQLTVAGAGALSIPSLTFPSGPVVRGDVIERFRITAAPLEAALAESQSITWPHGVTGSTQTINFRTQKPNDAVATTSSGFSRISSAGIIISPNLALVYGNDPLNPPAYTLTDPLFEEDTGEPIIV